MINKINEVKHLVKNIHKGDAFDEYIGRRTSGFQSSFGNPYKITKGDLNMTREAVISKYETFLLNSMSPSAIEIRKNLWKLKNKKLGCFCSPSLCHGHTLAYHAQGIEGQVALPVGGTRSRLTNEWEFIEPQDSQEELF